MLLSLPTATRADILHLRNGGAIRTAEWWIDGDVVHYVSAAGEVGIPRSELVRVETTVEPVETRERRAATPPSRKPATSRPDGHHGEMTAGASALQNRDFETAATRFRSAIELRPEDAQARVGYAVSEIALGRDALALGVVMAGLVHTPEVAELHEILGDLMNREERVEDAIRSWREAFRLDPNDRVREKILKGERELTAGRTLAYTSTAHFTFRYDGELDDDLAESIMDWLEDRYAVLSRELRHSPEQPITVLLYPERDFRQVTQAPENVGGLYDGKIRVPLGGLRRLDPRARAVLVHELTHAFVHSKTRANCPRWLQEGLAQRAEGRVLSERDRLDVVERINRYGPTRWDDDGLSYAAALSLVLHLESLRNDRGLVRLLESLGTGMSLDDALMDTYGVDYERLCRDWARTLVSARASR